MPMFCRLRVVNLIIVCVTKISDARIATYRVQRLYI